MDIYGQNWGMVGGKLVAVTGSRTISGPDKRSLMQTYNLKTGATISSVDIYGNQWGIDEKGKLGTKGAFVITGEHLGTKDIDGTTVTKMKNLLTGKISGTDLIGNKWGVDEKGEFRLLCQVVGTEVINGTEVTKMKDLLTGKIIWMDIFGNNYSVKDGKLTFVK
jgi:hypothetical protein